MRRYVVLGVNDNPTYQYYLPIVFWAWRKIEWEPMLFYSGNIMCKRMDLIAGTFDKLHEDMSIHMKQLYSLKCYPVHIDGYQSSTISQISRLFAACVNKNPETILMTSDIDMLPLSNYWSPSDLNITCYGRDLTDYHYPICYCAATPLKWIQFMLLDGNDYQESIKIELQWRNKKTNSWLWDQDILTERLNQYGKKLLHLVDRGTDPRTGYPIGRVDRSNWRLDHDQLIDAHLPHDILTNEKSYQKVMELLHHVWPLEDFTWFETYHQQFKKLI